VAAVDPRQEQQLKTSVCIAVACVSSLAIVPFATASDGLMEWQGSVGVDYSTGSYGAGTDTEILYVPFTVRAHGERLKAELTVPYMSLDGPGNAVGGASAPVPISAPSSETVSLSGLGDITAALGYLLPRFGESGPFAEVKVRFKFATAAEGLGTNEHDYSAQVDLYQPVGERLTLILSGGYQVLGDPPDLELDDGFIGQAGFSYKASQTVDAGALLDHRRKPFAGLDDQRSVIPFASWRASPWFGMTLYGVFGVTDSSPDHGGGLQLTRYW
jgi:hypothetical protein